MCKPQQHKLARLRAHAEGRQLQVHRNLRRETWWASRRRRPSVAPSFVAQRGVVCAAMAAAAAAASCTVVVTASHLAASPSGIPAIVACCGTTSSCRRTTAVSAIQPSVSKVVLLVVAVHSCCCAVGSAGATACSGLHAAEDIGGDARERVSQGHSSPTAICRSTTSAAPVTAPPVAVVASVLPARDEKKSAAFLPVLRRLWGLGIWAGQLASNGQNSRWPPRGEREGEKAAAAVEQQLAALAATSSPEIVLTAPSEWAFVYFCCG